MVVDVASVIARTARSVSGTVTVTMRPLVKTSRTAEPGRMVQLVRLGVHQRP